MVKKHLNSELEYEGILLTMFDARTNLSIQVAEEVKKFFGSQVFNAIIPRNVRLSEAPSHGLPIIAYDERSKGAEMYVQLAKEVIANEQKRLGKGLQALIPEIDETPLTEAIEMKLPRLK